MSKLKRSSSHHSLRSFLNLPPNGEPKPDRSKAYEGGSLPVHLCSSVQCDVIDVLKENIQRPSPAARKCRSQKHLVCSKMEPLMQPKKSPLSESKKHNRYVEAENKPPSELGDSTPLFCSTPNHRLYLWDEEAAPAPAWSTLGNRSLLLRPLPPDIGSCRCFIVREPGDGIQKPSVYSLYTDEGRGRQDRLLGVARHRRKVGRSEFLIAQNCVGTMVQCPDEGYLGYLSSNLVGSRYQIWEQADTTFSTQQPKMLQAIVLFEPTVTTLTGNSRKMRAFIPRCQLVHGNGSSCQLGYGLTKDWEENMPAVAELSSKTPRYNRLLKRYELDFRETVRTGCNIRSSVKNFQLTMEEYGKENILLMGKLSKSTYVMEYRFPLTGYQAFSICLASIDSKLCCTM